MVLLREVDLIRWSIGLSLIHWFSNKVGESVPVVHVMTPDVTIFFVLSHFPVQTQITNLNGIMLLPSSHFMTSHGDSCLSTQPELSLATLFNGALSWQFEVVKTDGSSHMVSYN